MGDLKKTKQCTQQISILAFIEEEGKYIFFMGSLILWKSQHEKRHSELFCERILKYFAWEVHKGSWSKKLT